MNIVFIYGNKLNILIYLVQLPGVLNATPTLSNFYQSMEKLSSAINALTKSMDSNTKCEGPNQGGLNKIANSLGITTKRTQKIATDLNKIIDSSGNLNGNLNPTLNDINKLGSAMDGLSKNIRSDARTRDYFSGNFKGVQTGLESWAKSLTKMGGVINRLRGLSKVFMNTEVTSTQVTKGIRDIRASITALTKSLNRHLKKCGKTAASIGNIIKGWADLNKAIGVIQDAV